MEQNTVLEQPIDNAEVDETPVPFEAVRIERAYSFLLDKLGMANADMLIPHVVELMIAKSYSG